MSFPSNLTKIDKLSLHEHSYLDNDDHCAFLGEYTAYKGFSHSVTNQLIINLKKEVDRRGKEEWKYKGIAIRTAAEALRKSIRADWLNSATFVPIPPSKKKTDPMYDDRMSQVLQNINPGNPVDWREIIIQTQSTAAAHESEIRLNPSQLYNLYEIDETQCNPGPARIVIVDDVVTAGAHFKAAQRILSEHFGNITIVGVFIARRVREADKFEPQATTIIRL